MGRVGGLFKSKPVGFIIIAACVAIVLILTASLMFATYASFKSGIDEAVNTQTSELSTQIVFNYENSIAGIIETSNIIQAEMDRFDLASPDANALFAALLGQIIYLKSDIIRVSVYDSETGLCAASSYVQEIGRPLDRGDAWFYEALADPTVHVFSTPYAEYGSAEYKVNVSKRIRFGGAGEGVLKIEIRFQSFIDLVDKSNLGAGGHVTIIDSDYNVVYSSMPETEASREGVEEASRIVLGSGSAVLGGFHMAAHVDTLSNTKWRICVFINIDKSVEIERTFFMTTVAVSCVVLVIGVFLFAAVARVITSPLKQLELAMRKVEKSDYFRMEEVELMASSEVEALAGRFNRMMRKIGELMGRVIDEQNAQRKSELKALQNQINPHFLYNTLDSILWLIENEKNGEAAEMVVALARLFRIGISGDSELIPVRDEIEHVRNYLLIQNIRYAGSFDYEFHVGDDARDIKTMKLVLQPVVENCIYHGLKNKIEKGSIRIDAGVEDGFLMLKVSDNGYGMRRETIEELYRTFEDGAVAGGVGLKNIYQRVMIYYGGNAGMTIDSELDEGTTVLIRQPLNGARDERPADAAAGVLGK